MSEQVNFDATTQPIAGIHNDDVSMHDGPFSQACNKRPRVNGEGAGPPEFPLHR